MRSDKSHSLVLRCRVSPPNIRYWWERLARSRDRKRPLRTSMDFTLFMNPAPSFLSFRTIICKSNGCTYRYILLFFFSKAASPNLKFGDSGCEPLNHSIGQWLWIFLPRYLMPSVGVLQYGAEFLAWMNAIKFRLSTARVEMWAQLQFPIPTALGRCISLSSAV